MKPSYPLDFLPKKISQALILFIMGLTTVASVAMAAEENPIFAPPWGKTSERIPQEVKDKENEQPLAWCENAERGEFEVTFVDANTGTRTRIKRRVRTIRGDTGIRLIEGIDWEVTIEGGGQPKRKITYTNLQPPGAKPADNETRTEQSGRDKPTTRPIREGDLFDPAKQPPAKKSFLPDSPIRFARVNFPASKLSSPLSRADSSIQELFMLLAATQERALPSTPSTQERPPLNVKLVTYGQPLENPVVHLGEDPQTTPEEFVQKPTGTPWNPGDEEGPKTAIPGDTGIPIASIPSGGINIGAGWASTQVPVSTLVSCSGDDEQSEGNKIIAETNARIGALRELEKNALDSGGPADWERRARTFDSEAKGYEGSLERGHMVPVLRKRAEEARQIAAELKKLGVPDKPDPTLPKQKLDQLENQRRAQIAKIFDVKVREARQEAQRRSGGL
jgi:hypothetical protein